MNNLFMSKKYKLCNMHDSLCKMDRKKILVDSTSFL